MRAKLPALLPLGAIVGISPFATDMYIPALPRIAIDLHTTASVVQLSLTAFLVSFAVGQLLFGSISDGIGRRPMIIGGTALFALASLACALTPSAGILIIARVVEGLGGAAASVAGRALVADTTSGLQRSRVFATLAAITAVGPVVAPLAGGALLTIGTWRLMFFALTAFGAALCVVSAITFPESLPREQRGGSGLGANLGRMGMLLKIPRFRWYLITGCSAIVGFFAYISTSSFVFQREYSFTEFQYTLVFATNASAMIVTTLLFRRLVVKYHDNTLLTIGLVAGVTGSGLVLVLGLTHASAYLVWASLMLVTAGWGFVMPGAMTVTQNLGNAAPGTAAALQGGLQFGFGGLSTPLAGLLGATAVAMGGVMFVFIVVALAAQLIATAISRSPRAIVPR
jgi:MFS transporter, DHA1 family, multidrug resistance protein